MDTSTTFLFEVVFRHIPVLGQTQSSLASDRSVFVEVEPDSLLTTTTYLPVEEAARECAIELVHAGTSHGTRTGPHRVVPGRAGSEQTASGSRG